METLQTRFVNFLLQCGMDRPDIHKMKTRFVKFILHCVFKCMSVDVDAHLQVRRRTECQHTKLRKGQNQVSPEENAKPLSSKSTGI